MVGNILVDVGYIFYKRGIWFDNKTFRIFMIALMVIVPVIMIIAAVAVMCRRRRGGMKLRQRYSKSELVGRYIAGRLLFQYGHHFSFHQPATVMYHSIER